MLSNHNHIINLGNYEEYFILYMDNELPADKKLMVEDFISQHPHLAEELEVLTSLKLPMDDVSFSGKDELLSGNMRANLVDESLLLYIDNELPLAERKTVEQKLISDKEYAAQHSILAQTKLDASEKILHPNKKELYRNTERVVVFKVWMRVAAAVILLLLGSLFFLTNRNEKITGVDKIVVTPVNDNTPNKKQEKQINPIEQLLKQQAPAQQDAPIVKGPAKKANNPVIKNITPDDKKDKKVQGINDVEFNDVVKQDAPKQREVTKFDVNRFTAEPQINDVNKTVAYTSVTSSSLNRKPEEGVKETAVPEDDFNDKKKAPAKGFFRKVSRFIERNTGIGTVNADNELLIGAVALKLK
jgi:hypothetical protein